ncbi:MAG: thiol reductant ABC exporter subunit CydD [Lactobacillales bacterium]|jgi:ATP-binding cassette subfamily C protein CydD|nr:thiol reductant ABC exporter subunit CydD [Lactobacillales bacterium]
MIDKSLFQLKNSKPIFGVLAGIAFLQALFIIGQAVGLGLAVTRMWEGKGVLPQVKYMFMFLGFYLLRHLMTYLRDWILDHYAYERSKEAREELLDKVFKLGPVVVQTEGTGNMVTMALEGISEMENYIHLVLSKILNMMILPVVFLIFVFFLDHTSALILLIVFPIIILFMIILGYAAQSKADSQYKSFQVLSNHFIDSLRGLETLKLFGLSKDYAKGIYTTSERFRKATMSTLKIAILSTFALDFFTTLSVAVVAVFLGLRLLRGEMFLFPALTALILAPEYFLPLRDFAGDYHATLNGKNAMQAVQKVRAMPVPQNTDLVAPFTWNENSELSAKHVNFAYDESQTGLLDLEFNWQGFKKIGVIGASGSGKSTFINLISGFLQPTSAEITLNGTKIPHFAQTNWQTQMSYIPQKTYLFHATLLDNIRFYTPDAEMDAVNRAVEAAGLAEVVRKLPDGLDTIIGEGGRNLSGGQAQRVALARAFLSDKRKVLLLDEPTAHLDIETEMELKENLVPLMEDKLVILATHRLHWMPQMDQILVIQGGKFVGVGTHEELLQTNAYYRKLVAEMRGEAHD